MSLAELHNSSDPLAREAAVMVEDACRGFRDPHVEGRLLHFIAKAAILRKADVEGSEPAQHAARLTAQFNAEEYQLPAGTRRRK